jgi:hypothetical protein
VKLPSVPTEKSKAERFFLRLFVAIVRNLAINESGTISVAAGKAPADIRPFIVDAAASPYQKFAAAVDLQAERAVERELQTRSPQRVEPFILLSGDL